VVIEAAPGMGKTTLLNAFVFDGRVLRARGLEREQSFGFGVMRQLFGGVERDALTGAARFAAPLLGKSPAAPSEDPFTARRAFYWLAANLAAEQPLALVVDDAQWADPASLGVLAHLAARLDGLELTMLVATRPSAVGELRRLASEQVTPRPLSAASVARLVRQFVPDADAALCAACHEVTGGNPFLADALARGLADGSVSPDAVAEPAITARLARLAPHEQALAQAAAVLGTGASMRHAQSLSGSNASAVAGVLRPGPVVEFEHPLIASAVYAGVKDVAGEHARAAQLLFDAGATPDRVAAQLLLCPPQHDEWAFERLVAAADRSRGAPEAVAAYLARALEEARRPELLVRLGAAESHFDAAASIAHLREALDAELDVERRYEATILLSGVLAHANRVSESADVLEAQMEAFDGGLRRALEAALANITRINPATRRRADAVLARMRARLATEDDPAVLGAIVAEMGMAGEPIDTMAALAVRAAVGLRATVTTAAGWSWYNAVRGLIVGERYELARSVLDEALEWARGRGAVLDIGGMLCFRSELFVHAGDLANAEVDARTLQEISLGYGWPLGLGAATSALGTVLLERGELSEAAAVLDGEVPEVYTYLLVLLARGRLRLAEGRIHEAVADLRELGRRCDAIDHLNPAVVAWRSWLALALSELGQTAEASWLARDELEKARAYGGRRALGVALRAVGLVTEDLTMLREATLVLDGSGAGLERARAHASLGGALRATGELDEARESLRMAIDLAHRCGAVALEESALSELRATGARPRRRLTTGSGSLTPSERRIAELAAAGQLNREIAEALFVTTATVEYHLRNAYRKLGIASRTQLAEALA
jgi:DNA-binding CsgD family transcriptional regulator